MTSYDAPLAGGAILRLDVTLGGQDVTNNQSSVIWSLTLIKGAYSSFTSTPIGYTAWIGPVPYSGTYTFDFRSSSQLTIASGITYLNHNADGTLTINVAGHTDDTRTQTGGPADPSGTYALPTIPRASKATYSPNPVTPGQSMTVFTNRASGNFWHTINWSFGKQSGQIGTGVTDSVSWTPPLSLMNEMPNQTSGDGALTTYTYSGGTLIGTTVTSFTVAVPASIVPTIGSISCSEGNPIVSTASIGAYVQTLSKLTLGIVGAAGAYGSTITASKLTVDGQTINAASGTTAPIASSGQVTVTATVTDSRGRTATATSTVSVLAYAPPTIDPTKLAVKRAYVDGSLHDDGTYVNASFTAAVSSLLSGTEKNSLTYRLSIRQHGTTNWTVANTTTPAGASFTGSKTVGTIDVAHSWDLLLEVFDKFATTAIMSTITTSTIFQHWDSSVGMGIGKYREQGMLDVAGQIYQNNGEMVQPTASIIMTAAATPPTGWLICDGTAVSRTTYAKLFAAIGTTYGVGNGSTTFNLPNLKGRVPVGVDAVQTEFATPGATGGEKTHVLTQNEMPSHAHSVNSIGYSGATGYPSSRYQVGFGGTRNTTGDVVTDNAGGGAAHNNLQPYIALNYLIKA